jgi:hypothetical protein
VKTVLKNVINIKKEKENEGIYLINLFCKNFIGGDYGDVAMVCKGFG